MDGSTPRQAVGCLINERTILFVCVCVFFFNLVRNMCPPWDETFPGPFFSFRTRAKNDRWSFGKKRVRFVFRA